MKFSEHAEKGGYDKEIQHSKTGDQNEINQKTQTYKESTQ